MGIAVFSEDASALAGWQNGHVERLIRSIRRECVNYIIGFVLDALAPCPEGPRFPLQRGQQTHLSLDRNAPAFRCPSQVGDIAEVPVPGGLDHQYVRVQVLSGRTPLGQFCGAGTSVRLCLRATLALEFRIDHCFEPGS